ncbi:MAG TPA: RodZ domain-containing protein [Burkholderiaceae bacterium]|nr:RodZ domain-containing protein [Burkholderiaceae bacterium]
MSESPAPAAAPPAPATTAGCLLRQARQAQGLHIAALAAAIKVVPRKLELLESDQFDQLPDPTFTRALAQTICRTLKIDAAPILALLPPPKGHRLEHVAGGLNTPFRERPGNMAPKEWASVKNPVLWIVAAIALLTLAVYAVPASWLPFSTAAVTRVRPPETAVRPAALSAPAVALPVAASAPPSTPVPADVAASGTPVAEPPAALTEPDAVTAAAASGVLQFSASAQSWVEVTDARGQSLIARVLEPGESVGLDGVMPLKVKVGNAAGTQLVFRGQPLALAAYTRDNVARLELK